MAKTTLSTRFTQEEVEALKAVCEKEKRVQREATARKLVSDFLIWGEYYRVEKASYHAMGAMDAIGLSRKKADKLSGRMVGWLLRSDWFKP